jgi:hypothetical protein
MELGLDAAMLEDTVTDQVQQGVASPLGRVDGKDEHLPLRNALGRAGVSPEEGAVLLGGAGVNSRHRAWKSDRVSVTSSLGFR